jgi:hypothetical protein
VRITVLDDDPGRKINAGHERYRILFNGNELRRCVTADDGLGEAIIIAEDSAGKIMLENGEIRYETLHGIVSIERIQ